MFKKTISLFLCLSMIVSLFSGVFAYATDDSMFIEKKLENKDNYTINFVGDSVTWGLSHCTAEETYVAQFAKILAQKFPQFTVRRYDGIVSNEMQPMNGFDGPIMVSEDRGTKTIDVIRNGIGGNTCVRALNRIDDFTNTLANGKEADITVLMFGINDALQSDASKYVTPEQFKINYKALIDEIRTRDPDTYLIIMSATTNDQTIEAHCEKTKELAEEEGIYFIDLHSLWQEKYDASASNFGYGDWLASPYDACHPTPIGAKASAEFIYENMIDVIGTSSLEETNAPNVVTLNGSGATQSDSTRVVYKGVSNTNQTAKAAMGGDSWNYDNLAKSTNISYQGYYKTTPRNIANTKLTTITDGALNVHVDSGWPWGDFWNGKENYVAGYPQHIENIGGTDYYVADYSGNSYIDFVVSLDSIYDIKGLLVSVSAPVWKIGSYEIYAAKDRSILFDSQPIATYSIDKSLWFDNSGNQVGDNKKPLPQAIKDNVVDTWKIAEDANIQAKYIGFRVKQMSVSMTKSYNENHLKSTLRLSEIAVYGEVNHTHAWEKYGFDNDNHWKVCTICDGKDESSQAPHNFSKSNICVCGKQEEILSQNTYSGGKASYEGAVNLNDSLILNVASEGKFINTYKGISTPSYMPIFKNDSFIMDHTSITQNTVPADNSTNFFNCIGDGYALFLYGGQLIDNEKDVYADLVYNIGYKSKVNKVAFYGLTETRLCPYHYKFSFANSAEDLFTENAVYNSGDFYNTKNYAILTAKKDIECSYFGMRIICGIQQNHGLGNWEAGAFIRMGNVSIYGEKGESTARPVDEKTYNDVDLTKNSGTYDKYFWDNDVAYHETVMFYKGRTTAKLLYPIDEVISVRSYDLQREYKLGVDYNITADGQLEVISSGDIPVYEYPDHIRDTSRGDIWQITQPKYLLAVTYKHSKTWSTTSQLYETSPQAKESVVNKLKTVLGSGETRNIVFIGDSITEGWNATGLNENAIYQKNLTKHNSNLYTCLGLSSAPAWGTDIWAKQVTANLKKEYKNDNLTFTNLGSAGTTSGWFINNSGTLLGSNYCPSRPDVAFIAYGMNEGQKPGTDYVNNVKQIVAKLRAMNSDCVIVLVSAFMPNHYDAAGNLYSWYLSAQEQACINFAATDDNIVVAPVYSYFKSMANVKNPVDYTGNAFNHPNDFGVKMYAHVVSSVVGATHTHSYTTKKDADYHWNECDCGEIEEGSKATHTYVGATCTKAGVCSCGAQGAKLAHKYSTSYTSDGTYHWKKCSCGAITAKAKHTSKTSVTKKAKTSANGTQVTTCSTCKKTLKTTTIYKASSVKLSTTEYEYNGKTKKPSVKVYDSKGKKLVYGTDYTYKRPSSSKKVGKYSIKVTFKGKYSGTKTLYYTINPADTKITSLKAGSKKLTVKCSKKTKYSDGYQIQYSTSSKFSSKYTKTVTIKKDTTTSATIKGLKAKKKYYVRVRCYYGSKTKYYSDWSSKKSATTKK